MTTAQATERKMHRLPKHKACPACSHALAYDTDVAGVHECARCTAVFGHCYLGDSYKFAWPKWSPTEPPHDQLQHFDLECLGSEGITRRHGWVDRATKLLVQTG